MQPLSSHRPRKAAVARAEGVKTSDIVLAVTGVALLGSLCLALAGHLIGF